MIKESTIEALIGVAYIRTDFSHFFEVVADVKKKGVAVKVLMDSANTDLAVDQFFRNNGIEYRRASNYHSKMIIVDTKALVGSFNLTRNSARFKSEAAVYCTAPQVVADLREEFYRIWNSVNTKLTSRLRSYSHGGPTSVAATSSS